GRPAPAAGPTPAPRRAPPPPAPPRRTAPRSAAPVASRLAFACLGSSGAVPSAERDTTALAVRAGGTVCLIDVGGSPVQKLRRVGGDPVDPAAGLGPPPPPPHRDRAPAPLPAPLDPPRRAPP